MKIGKELMKGSIPMLLLSLLSRGDMYGYQMIQQMKLISKDTFELKEGTIYPILHSLENDGAVEAYWQDSADGRRRKYYRITEDGRQLLNDKRREWTLYSEAMELILGGA